ncbi:MAG: hypothetical protein ACOC97_03545 [Myxococcota bacterium]
MRLFAEPAQALVPGARPFAMGADARGVYATQLGSWTEPLMATGMVVRTGPLERGPVQVGVPEWLGMHELVLRQGDEHVVLQYDAPAAPAPVRRGETIRVYALTTRVGPRLAFAMSVFDARGDLTMAGLRTPRASQELLPPGWWVEFGPTTRTSPLCDGHLAERAVRVRGPGGEAVVAPGWTSVAALGRDGTRYAVDVARSHRAEATCPQAEAQTDLSVVIRRLEG